jgi:hypothetical protein
MLVEAVRKHPSAPHGTRGWLAVAHHPDDDDCATAIGDYCMLLNDADGCLLDWSLDHLVEVWRPLVSGDNATWLEHFTERYVDVSASEPAWKERSAEPGQTIRDG